MVKGRRDQILGVIRIIWIHEIKFLETDNSKSCGRILMKFSGYVLNGTRNK